MPNQMRDALSNNRIEKSYDAISNCFRYDCFKITRHTAEFCKDLIIQICNFIKVGQKKVFIIYFNESPSKMMKNVFYFILKALCVLKIFKFLS